MYSPEAVLEPFEESQTGSPPVSSRQDYGFPAAASDASATPWQRRKLSVTSSVSEVRPVFESLASSHSIHQLGPPLSPSKMGSPPAHLLIPLPPSPTAPTTKPLGAPRRLSRASKNGDVSAPFTSPPKSKQPLPTPQTSAPPFAPILTPPELQAPLAPGSRLQLPPHTPPHAALASPTLSSSRRTSGSSVDRITPPSSSSSLASIPGLGPSQFSGGMTPDLSNPYRSQMERPLDTVKRLSRQVERRDYTRGAPSAGGPSSFRADEMFGGHEKAGKSSHSPTPSSYSAPPFVMSGAYPSSTSMNGAYPAIPMNGAYPSALAMSGPYPTRGSQLSSFENPWPTWEGPSSSTIDAKLASKKARRMSSAPNGKDGDRRKEHGSIATRTKSHGKEREHLSPNGSPTLGNGGSSYAPSPLSQASSPVASLSGSPPLSPAVVPMVLERSGSKKKKRLSMWGRTKAEDESLLPTGSKKDGLIAEESRSRTFSAPAKTSQTKANSVPPVPAIPATISSPRSTSNLRSKAASPTRAPPPLAIKTSELAPPLAVSPSSSAKTVTPSGGGLLSKFGSKGRNASSKSAPPSPSKTPVAKKAAPSAAAPVLAPVPAPGPRKVSRGDALKEEAKQEKGLGGLWKRLSVSKKGKGASPVSPVRGAAGEKDKDASKAGKNSVCGRGQVAAPPVVADVVVAPTPSTNGIHPASPPLSRQSAPHSQATPERVKGSHHASAPSSTSSSSSTTTARPTPTRPQDAQTAPPPSNNAASAGSRHTTITHHRSPPRAPPTEALPPTPTPLYGSTEAGVLPSLPRPVRGLPTPPRVSAPFFTTAGSPSPSSPPTVVRKLPQAPAPILRGQSYDPPSPGASQSYDALSRSTSHPSRPPTPPSKDVFGHELAQTSSSSAGSEGSRQLWEPRTAGSSFTVYTATSEVEDEGRVAGGEGLKV